MSLCLKDDLILLNKQTTLTVFWERQSLSHLLCLQTDFVFSVVLCLITGGIGSSAGRNWFTKLENATVELYNDIASFIDTYKSIFRVMQPHKLKIWYFDH